MKRYGLLACAWLLMSCDPSTACDPGSHEDTGSCVPNKVKVTKDAGADDDSGSASSADSGATAACTPGPGNYGGFGKVCATDSDCDCNAPTCATPGLEYCSRLKCNEQSDACPPGWLCTDVSAFAMPPGTTTFMCIKQ